MIAWTLALALAVGGAWLAYGPLPWSATGRTRTGSASLLLGGVRGAMYLLVVALLVGAPGAAGLTEGPAVVLDASESWRRADDGTLWRQALDSVRQLAGDSVWLDGDSARPVASRTLGALEPTDRHSRVQDALDAVAAAGRAAVLVTDGELEDPSRAPRLPPGSRVIVLPRPPRVDAAVSDVEMPTVVTGGDTIDVYATIVAGNAPTRPGTLEVRVDGDVAVRTAVPAIDEPFGARRISLRTPVPRGARGSVVELAVAVPNDVESRNDTLALPLEVIDRPRAVFVSTAPDLDVREALRVLRGTVAVPTRAYLRIAPGIWREEGTLAPITEAEVTARAKAAGLLVLHGDSLWAGVRTGSRGALVLWQPAPPPPPPRAGEVARPTEWFVARVPASPLAAVLEALPLDSLPLVALPSLPPSSADASSLLDVRLGRAGSPIPLATWHQERGQRVVRIRGSGFAGWVQRGGRSADAFTALWGALFDWAAASEGIGEGVRVVGAPLRAGAPVRWRRSGEDSIVTVVLRERGGRIDSLALRFPEAAEFALSRPLEPGVYAVAGGASSPVVVNVSREWVPRLPLAAATVAAGPAPAPPRRPLREQSWPFVAALLLLCAEWLGRRAVGLR
jgi:hypothetical protein